MPRLFKSLVSALLLAVSLTMQGVFLPSLQASPVDQMSKPDDIASLFDMNKHDSKNSQQERFCDADDQDEDDQDEDQSLEEENASWQLDSCSIFYQPLALQSFSELFPVESTHRPISPLSGIFRPPRA